MIGFTRNAIVGTACIASVSAASALMAEGKPYTPPIKFDYAIIPVKGCVLRPTNNPAQTEMACTPDAKTIAQCSETKGELGSIDGQLMCRTPRAAMGPAGKPGAAVSPYEPPYGPDAQTEARWKPKIITIKTRPAPATQAGSAGKEGQ